MGSRKADNLRYGSIRLYVSINQSKFLRMTFNPSLLPKVCDNSLLGHVMKIAIDFLPQET